MAEASEFRSFASLVIPCRPEYVALGRLVAGSLGAREGWDEEDITDLKMVLSEVSSFFLAPPEFHSGEEGASTPEAPCASSNSTLRLDFETMPEDWTLTVSNPDLELRLPTGAFSDPLSERSLGLTIIRALVDSVEQTDDHDEGTVFRLRKHLSSADCHED